MDVRSHYESLAVEREFRILGIRLLPLSVGHAKLLPALGMSSPESMPELVASLLLCSVPAKDAVRKMQSRFWRTLAMARAAVIGFCIRAVSGRAKCGPAVLFIAASKRWSDYVRHFRQMPTVRPVRPSEATGAESETPFLAHVERALACEYGLTQEQIDSMPLDQALWRFAISREASGDAYLTESLGDDEIEAMQRMADQNKERWIAEALRGANPC